MDFDWNNVGIGNLCAFWLSFALYRMQWVVWIGRLGEKWWDYEKMPKWGMSLFSCASSFLLYIVVFPSSSILCIPLNLVEKNECDWWILLLEVLYSKLLVLFSSCIPIILFREWQSPRILERILPISLKALHYISWRNGLLGRESLFFFFDISMDLPWILILVSWCLELCKKSRHNQMYQLFHSFFSIASVHYLRKPKAR